METTSKRILNFTKEMQIEKLPYLTVTYWLLSSRLKVECLFLKFVVSAEWPAPHFTNAERVLCDERGRLG